MVVARQEDPVVELLGPDFIADGSVRFRLAGAVGAGSACSRYW